VTACIGEPISWLRLEAFALGAPDLAIPLHTAACPVCRRCLDQIRGEVIALPVLEVPAELAPPRSWLARRWRLARRGWHPRRDAQPARRRWWPALALAAAAALAALAAIVVIAPRDSRSRDAPLVTATTSPDAAPPGAVSVKGVGEVLLELVRERAGEIRHDAQRFARGDRWKAVVTCAPSATVWVEVSVNDGVTIDRPVPPAQVICGNRVVVPGAFTISGMGAHRVCARIAPGPGAPSAAACTTLRPE
jgi:hypothetical protein